jgi:hypothetical protein
MASSTMKRLHVAKHAPEAHLIRGFLESNGVPAVVRGDLLTTGWGELPVDLCAVWVTHEADYERAHALLLSFLRGDLAREYRDQNWRCSKCGEALEGQFTECWSCGTRRPAHS